MTLADAATGKQVSAVEPGEIDVDALAAELAARLRGEVRFDAGSRGLYARDASNYRQIPIGVVIPRDADDVVATVELARKYGAPILGRGGGTSLAGQCCNVGLVIDFSKYMHRILEINAAERYAWVEPGCILDDLRDRAEEHHLTFGPDPATHNHCTLGGMIGNNSCGVHSVMAGRTADNVEELEILTYEGLRMTVGPISDEECEQIIAAGGPRSEIYRHLRNLRDHYAEAIRRRYPDIPRRVSGYNLDELLPEKGFHVARALVGSESTCVLVLSAKLRLIPSPPARTLLVLGYRDVATAGDDAPDVLKTGPIGLEAVDHRLVEFMKDKQLHPADLELLPEGKGWLIVEYGGDTKQESDAKARAAVEELHRRRDDADHKLYDDPYQEERVWEIRESGLGATAFVPNMRDSWPGWEDAAVPPERVGEYVRDFRDLLQRYGYECSLYGHFGQGCVHTRIDFDLFTEHGIAHYRQFAHEAAELVVRYGGSLSGEHGDGQSRGELLPIMFGDEVVAAFRRFKSIWDPRGKMNPGKIVDPYPLDSNLALGTDYNPRPVTTYFSFPDDGGDFAHATLRCVGVGKCRREQGGTMCPSYMVTREEKHTTRGRAHLLFEMLQGDVVTDGWQSEEVKEALDLCLACKGCKGDCPVNVDMATYKAEFLAHYYERHWRPRSAWSMGRIHLWARIAAWMPGLVNWLGTAPMVSRLVKAIGGISQQRQMPEFAAEPFTTWFARHRPRNVGATQVLLWPDTFNNYFHPEVAQAAVGVLEDAGFHVLVPERSVCCGRPLYDYGFLDAAKQLLLRDLETLRPLIRAGVPLVGLEPSCVAVFRDEMTNLLPHDQDAQRLREQTFLFGEFLDMRAPDYRPPRLEGEALVHVHCHQKAVLSDHADLQVLEKMGLRCQDVDSGCCGMAGSFGFEADHYDLSMACGERALLPAVRQAPRDQIIVANGFSCQEQILQSTPRRALHLAQVIELAKNVELQGIRGGRPESHVRQSPKPRTSGRAVFTVAGIAATAAVAWGLWKHHRRSREP